MRKYLFALLALALVLASCKKDDPAPPSTTNNNTTQPAKKGFVEGTLTTLNGTPVPNAKVFIDDAGEIYLTMSDVNGAFRLEAPVGDQVINFQTGDGQIFRSQANVTITENGTTQMAGTEAKLGQAGALAYITGAYDKIEAIIIDSLGYSATMLTISDLDNLNTLNQYSAIFLNCGKSGTLDSLKYANLLNYVMGGGSLYASDWAVEYLTGDGNFRLASGGGHGHVHDHHALEVNQNKTATCVGWLGGFVDDNSLCTQKGGSTGMVMGASVVAPDIQAVVGSNMDVYYDLGGWDVIQTLSSDWEVLIQDNNTGYGPLAIRLDVNQNGPFDPIGNPSSGGNGGNSGNGWVTICHIPPGNPSNPVTITISTNALQTHLNHGDQLGPCSGGTGGQIYYTTFHNHPYGAVSQQVEDILQYFVLNL